MADAYHNLGLVKTKQGDFNEALKYHFAALKIKEELGNKIGIADENYNIGINYGYSLNYPAALKYHRIALNLKIEIGNNLEIAYEYKRYW